MNSETQIGDQPKIAKLSNKLVEPEYDCGVFSALIEPEKIASVLLRFYQEHPDRIIDCLVFSPTRMKIKGEDITVVEGLLTADTHIKTLLGW